MWRGNSAVVDQFERSECRIANPHTIRRISLGILSVIACFLLYEAGTTQTTRPLYPIRFSALQFPLQAREFGTHRTSFVHKWQSVQGKRKTVKAREGCIQPLSTFFYLSRSGEPATTEGRRPAWMKRRVAGAVS